MMVLTFFSIHKKKPRLVHRILNEWKPKAIGFVQDEESCSLDLIVFRLQFLVLYQFKLPKNIAFLTYQNGKL
jgi:hypothetical protein